jgi:PAS domain S-box-containing protein
MDKGIVGTAVFDNFTDNAETFVSLIKTYLGDMSCGLCFVNSDNIILSINYIVEEISGYTCSELVGKSITELQFITPDVIKNIIQATDNNRAYDNRSSSFEFEVLTKNGLKKWLSFTVVPIKKKQGQGEYIGSLIFIFDNSETRMNFNNLQFAGIVLNSIKDGIIITGDGLVITEWNEACENMFGLKACEAVGKKLFEVFNVVYPSYDEVRLLGKKLMDEKVGRNTNLESLVSINNKTLWIEALPQIVKDAQGNIIGSLIIVTDISKRKKLEEELSFSDKALKSIKESVVVIDMDYKITYWNEASERLFKVKKRHAIGKNLFKVIKLIDRDAIDKKEAMEDLEAGKSLNFECRVMVDNNQIWIDVFPHIIKDNNGTNVAILSIVTDVNRRKLSEIKLLDSVAGLAEAQKIARLGSWQIDMVKNDVFWSDELYRLFGYHPGEVTPSRELFFSHVYEADWNIFEETLKKDLIQGADIVVRFRRKDGRIWYGHARSKAFFDSIGNPVTLFGSVQDITAQMKTEMKLRESEASLAEAQKMAKLGSWYLDTDTNKLVWSDELYRLFGYQPGEIIPTKEFFNNAVHPDDIRLLKNTIALQDSITGEQETTNIIVRLYRKNGEIWYANSRANSIYDDSGKMIKQYGSIQDITDIKSAEEREKQMQQELFNANHMASIGEMASGIAHEINNPLTGVVGFSQLLIKRDIPEDIKEDLEIINTEAQRAAKIVSGLLTFAYQNKPGWSMVDINRIIIDTLELRTYEMKLSNITVEVDLDEGIPHIAADGAQIQQVFLNIMLNAEHAMKKMKKRGTLKVSTELSGKNIIISFTDTGHGISKENLPKIFNPFFTTRKVGEGTGLGLSMSHGIIKQHNGKISVESELGQGATFIIELPVTGITDSMEEGEEMDNGIWGNGCKKGLLIDDEKPILSYLSRLLGIWGFESETVANAREAMTIIRKNDFDFILLDVKMPDMNGLEFYRQLKKTKPDLARKVLFVTGDVLEKATSNFLKENNVPSITKPIDIDKLKESIDMIVNTEQKVC